MGLFICILLAQADAARPPLHSADLGWHRLLTGTAVFQLVLWTGLRWGRFGLVTYGAVGSLMAIGVGLTLPVTLNRIAGGTPSRGAEVEVLDRFCNGHLSRVKVRALADDPTPRWEKVANRTCWKLNRSQVVQFDDADGALGVRWRSGAHWTDTEGALSWHGRAFDAMERKQWDVCLDTADRSLDLQPEGTGGRVYAVRGYCAENLGLLDLALEDFTTGCEGRNEYCCRNQPRLARMVTKP